MTGTSEWSYAGDQEQIVKPKPAPESLASLFHYLFDSDDMTLDAIQWPPDAFCFAATALERSSAYTILIGDKKPTISFKHREKDREAALEAVGNTWRSAAGRGRRPPNEVANWLRLIRDNRNTRLSELTNRKRTVAALLNILAAADEACTGLGISLTSAGEDRFQNKAEIQLFPRENGSTLCKRIDPSRARVLPKCHTAQTGLTIRSFSHFLALVLSTEVCPDWYSFCADTNEFALNLLLVPWPTRILPKQFRASATRQITDEVARGGYGLFTYDALGEPDIRWLTRLVRTAERTVGRIDGVVLPELALNRRSVRRVSKAFVHENRFLIAGIGEPAQEEKCGENYIRFDVMLPGGEYIAQMTQSKHHRWKLNKDQIIQYGLGSTLHPEANHWEHIRLSDRHLELVTLRPWLTICVLLCEDLARPDPLSEILHSVGPNLVISLLMDGPQISRRWPARCATTLADDPGCSVLTLTSSGMSNLSKAPPGIASRSACIALWKDARTGDSKELELPPGADALAINIAVEYREEWTADGRGDGGNAGYPYLAGQHPIKLGPRGV